MNNEQLLKQVREAIEYQKPFAERTEKYYQCLYNAGAGDEEVLFERKRQEFFKTNLLSLLFMEKMLSEPSGMRCCAGLDVFDEDDIPERAMSRAFKEMVQQALKELEE